MRNVWIWTRKLSNYQSVHSYSMAAKSMNILCTLGISIIKVIILENHNRYCTPKVLKDFTQ